MTREWMVGRGVLGKKKAHTNVRGERGLGVIVFGWAGKGHFMQHGLNIH